MTRLNPRRYAPSATERRSSPWLYVEEVEPCLGLVVVLNESRMEELLETERKYKLLQSLTPWSLCCLANRRRGEGRTLDEEVMVWTAGDMSMIEGFIDASEGGGGGGVTDDTAHPAVLTVRRKPLPKKAKVKEC